MDDVCSNFGILGVEKLMKGIEGNQVYPNYRHLIQNDVAMSRGLGLPYYDLMKTFMVVLEKAGA